MRRIGLTYTCLILASVALVLETIGVTYLNPAFCFISGTLGVLALVVAGLSLGLKE